MPARLEDIIRKKCPVPSDYMLWPPKVDDTTATIRCMWVDMRRKRIPWHMPKPLDVSKLPKLLTHQRKTYKLEHSIAEVTARERVPTPAEQIEQLAEKLWQRLRPIFRRS